MKQHSMKNEVFNPGFLSKSEQIGRKLWICLHLLKKSFKNGKFFMECNTFNKIYNPYHNTLELYNVLVQLRFATNKTELDI